jgi:hypothetical protein
VNTNEDSNGAYYVYGFTPAGLVPEGAEGTTADAGACAGLFNAGIDEPHPPFFRRSGRVAAVLSRVSQSEFCGSPGEKNLQDLAWLAPRACRHEAVLESFMRLHESAMGRFLERVAGQEEWAVKGFFDQARAESDWLAQWRCEKPCRTDSPPGLAYLQEQSLRLQAREALDDRLAKVCGDLESELSLVASDMAPRRILARERPEAGREMILNWALLLPSAAVADFRGRVERVNAQEPLGGLAFEVSGPWPPYSFCQALEAEAVSEGAIRER